MRGKNSIAKATAPWPAKVAMAAFSLCGARKCGNHRAFLIRPLSAALGPRTLRTMSASASAALAAGACWRPAAT